MKILKCLRLFLFAILLAVILGHSTQVFSDNGPALSLPVDVFSSGDVVPNIGCLAFSSTEVSLPGKTFPLNITRSYNSLQYKSNPTDNINLNESWGGWAGHGWSFGFAQRAFVVRLGSAFGSEAGNFKIIIQSNGGFEGYIYSSPQKFVSTNPTNFNYAATEMNPLS